MSDLILWRRQRLKEIRKELDHLFAVVCQELGNPPGLCSPLSGTSYTEVIETEKEVIVRAEVPGFAPNELDVEVAGDRLILTGTLEPTQDGKACGIVQAGRFRQTIRLPAKVDAEEATAKYAQGILTIVLPKLLRSGPKRMVIVQD